MARGRVFGWDRRDEDDGATFDGMTEFVTGRFSRRTLPNPFGEPVSRCFIDSTEVECGSVQDDKTDGR